MIFPFLTFENLHLLDCQAYAWGEKGLSGISTSLRHGLRVLIHAQSQEEGDLRFSALRLPAISGITELSGPIVHLHQPKLVPSVGTQELR